MKYVKTLKRCLITLVAVSLLLPSSSLASPLEHSSYSPYDFFFKVYSRHYLPEYDYRHLIAQCRQESGPEFSTYARSPAGAVGVCQFMKPTWMDAQVALGFIAPRTNARLNIKASAWYMRKMLFVWRGRERDKMRKLPLAQSSYNCGLGCVLRAQHKAGDARDWEDIAPFLPAEARDYPIHIRRHYRKMTGE